MLPLHMVLKQRRNEKKRGWIKHIIMMPLLSVGSKRFRKIRMNGCLYGSSVKRNVLCTKELHANTDEASVNAAVKDIVDTAKTSTTDSQKLAAIEKYVDLGSAPIKSVTKDSPATVAPGYYLIKDKAAGSVGDYDAYTLYIVKVAGCLLYTSRCV